jgi:hypothetical protein
MKAMRAIIKSKRQTPLYYPQSCNHLFGAEDGHGCRKKGGYYGRCGVALHMHSKPYRRGEWEDSHKNSEKRCELGI